MRDIELSEGEHYHIYNRGVDKRDIFLDEKDFERFLKSMIEFNCIEPIGSIYENSFSTKLRDPVPKDKKDNPLVDFVAYCLNSNHYHFLLQQSAEKGVEKFMHRLGVGYTMYFNQKYKRTGALFQGTFKAIHVDSNEQLLRLSAYVNLNNKVHKLSESVTRSSWMEYVDNPKSFLCNKAIIAEQFSTNDYKMFAEEAIQDIIEKRKFQKMCEY